MIKAAVWVAGLVLCACTGSAFAQAMPLWQDYGSLIDRESAVGVLGPNLFGDQVDFYSGTLSFSATDVSVPGNNALPVAVTRKKAIVDHSSSHGDGAFADWSLDLPQIEGVFSTTKGYFEAAVGWVGSGPNRCSNPGPPPSITFPSVDFPAETYWYGNHMSLPGGGGGELMVALAGTPKPSTGATYYWLASDQTQVSCLPTLANDSGEGFLAITAEGTKYWFNWMSAYPARELRRARRGPHATGEEVLYRRRYVLSATRVEDRIGNWVTYTYTNGPDAPRHITSMDAGSPAGSDGRHIAFAYNADGTVASVTSGSQAWQYTYGVGQNYWGVPGGSTLTAVTLPDHSSWKIDFKKLSSANLWYRHEPRNPGMNCEDPGDVDEVPLSGSITHPSGAVGTFTVQATRFGRSNVLEMCSNVTVSQTNSARGWTFTTPPDDPSDNTAYYPIAWDSLALIQKQISGPGLIPSTWDYNYASTRSWFLDPSGGDLPVCTAGDCVSPKCTSDDCAGTAVTQVCGPNNEYLRYTFGNSYRYNEGKLLTTEIGTKAPTLACDQGSILKISTSTYVLAQSGQPFATPIGRSPQIRSGAGFTSEFVRPQKTTALTYDSTTFSSQVNSFDQFARPLSVLKSSTLGFSKTETTSYADNLSQWVLGQTASVTDSGTGKIISRTDYNALAQPIRNYSFEVLQNALTYNPDGTLATVTDGKNQTTSLSNWYRGIPQQISYANGTTQRAAVNPSGWLTAATDENEVVTNYGYDAMGRLASIVYPTGDNIPWNSTLRGFVQVDVSEYEIPAGHWKQTVQTGTGQTTTFYDAQWRPLVTLTEDTANPSTRSFVVNRYNEQGQLVFASYPVASLSDVGQPLFGTTTSYDALGRVTRVAQDSEMGLLTTTTKFLPGFQTLVTNPRGKQTTTSYQSFDAPSTDAPVMVVSPGGVSTRIVRDVFGKPRAVTRTGPGG